MSKILQALAWAGAIIAFAIFAKDAGMSDTASFGVVSGLVGAAWASMSGDTGCGRGCLS